MDISQRPSKWGRAIAEANVRIPGNAVGLQETATAGW